MFLNNALCLKKGFGVNTKFLTIGFMLMERII